MLLRHEREGCGSKKNKEAALSVPEGTTPEMRFLDALMRRTVRGMTERGDMTKDKRLFFLIGDGVITVTAPRVAF